MNFFWWPTETAVFVGKFWICRKANAIHATSTNIQILSQSTNAINRLYKQIWIIYSSTQLFQWLLPFTNTSSKKYCTIFLFLTPYIISSFTRTNFFPLLIILYSVMVIIVLFLPCLIFFSSSSTVFLSISIFPFRFFSTKTNIYYQIIYSTID